MSHAAVLDTKDLFSKFKPFIYKDTLLRERELAYFITPLSDTEQDKCKGIWQPVRNRPASESEIKKEIQILLTEIYYYKIMLH